VGKSVISKRRLDYLRLSVKIANSIYVRHLKFKSLQLFAEAEKVGYNPKKKQSDQPTPYHGYLYKILKGTGKERTGRKI